MTGGHSISGAHDQSVKVAEEVLRAGGNAFDALCAAYWISCTAEPAMASLSSGAMAVVQPSGEPVVFLDGFCQTPSFNDPLAPLSTIEVFFEGTREEYYGGAASIAIPGVVKLLFHLHGRYGRMPMPELARPAIDLAEKGLALNDFQQEDLSLLRDVFLQDPYLQAHFTRDGQIKPVGAVIANPDFADTLEALTREGERLFYEGELAQMTADSLPGRQMTREDFERYTLRAVAPLRIPFHEGDIYAADLPSKGAYILAALLAGVHTQGQLIDRTRVVRPLGGNLRALSRWHDLPTSELLMTPPTAGGTSHINIMDSLGNMISMSYSLGEGSGLVLPGTGVHLNNMLGEPSLLPEGLRSWLPDRRLQSRMTPLLYIDPAQTLCAGTGGADRIPFMLSQVLLEWAHGASPQDSVQAPRFNFVNDTWHCEPGWEAPNLKKNDKIVAWKENNMYFGGVHLSAFAQKYEAVGDLRRMGGHSELKT